MYNINLFFGVYVGSMCVWYTKQLKTPYIDTLHRYIPPLIFELEISKGLYGGWELRFGVGLKCRYLILITKLELSALV